MPEYRHLNSDERLFVGSIILEYLTPLIADDYIFETLVMEMFKQFIMLGKIESVHVALMTFEILHPPERYR